MNIAPYLQYCPPESLFFGRPEYDGGRFELSDQAVPEGWQRQSDTEWVHILPPEPLPVQGWKIHVSATADSAQRVLHACWEYCTANRIAFKFLRSLQVLVLQSSKYAERSGSGKFITIYPRDEAELETVLGELNPHITGSPGPSILSDVRWQDGPLYLRYGAFHVRYLRDSYGRKTLAIEGPDGDLIPDERRPGFHVPEWVKVPPIVTRAIEERNKGRLDNFPYRPTKALHFSNGGGVYLGKDSEGSEVLLKEARPYAGLDGGGADAVTRLEREAWAYRKLDDVEQVPGLIDYRLGHQHYFLVRDFVVGDPLATVVRQRNPLLKCGSTAEEYAEYREWALDLLVHIGEVVEAMHARGVLFGDLHPSNILITPAGEICFIDLEGARPIETDEPQLLGAPGYIAPAPFRGAAIDDYAWAVMSIDLFVPSARLISWSSDKADELIRFATDRFDLPLSHQEAIRAGLREDLPRFDESAAMSLPRALQDDLGPSLWPCSAAGPPDEDIDWSAFSAEIAAGIIATATPERKDSLYPGDVEAFRHDNGQIGFLNGAAGVLWSLRTCGVRIPTEHHEWLVRTASSAEWTQPGFGHGLSGVAVALSALGEFDLARQFTREAMEMRPEEVDNSLLNGRAGLGLAALTVAAETGDHDLVDSAVKVAEDIISVLDAENMVVAEPGLLQGSAGTALFLCRLYEATREQPLLDAARWALHSDIALLVEQARSTLGQDYDIITRMPLVAGGSGGIALVADRLLSSIDDPDLARFRDRTLGALNLPFTEEPNIFWGHAGLMMLLRSLAPEGPEATSEAIRQAMIGHARTMGLHSVSYRGRPVVTGRFGLRISSDFATGTAGTMLAVTAIDSPVKMPLL